MTTNEELLNKHGLRALALVAFTIVVIGITREMSS